MHSLDIWLTEHERAWHSLDPAIRLPDNTPLRKIVGLFAPGLRLRQAFFPSANHKQASLPLECPLAGIIGFHSKNDHPSPRNTAPD
jgi:hypothetical protein